MRVNEGIVYSVYSLSVSDTTIAEMIKEETDAEEFRERIQVEQGDFIVFHRLSETKS